MIDHVPIRLNHHTRDDRLFLEYLPENIRAFYYATYYHDDFKAALKALEHTFQMGLLGGSDSIGCTITGIPGVGKTFLLEKFIANIYAEPHFAPTTELTPLPVLKIRVPGKPTMKKIEEKLLYCGRHIAPSGRNTETTNTRLRRLIEHQQVRMIIFDEFQHMLRRYAQVSTNDVMAELKNLADDMGISFVYSGLPEGLDFLDQFPEVKARASMDHVALQPFSLNPKVASDAQRKSYIAYMNSINNKLLELGFDVTPLNDQEMMQRMILATQGIPRFIDRLLLKTLVRCQNQSSIDVSDIGAAFQTMGLSDHLGQFDPFEGVIDAVIEKYINLTNPPEDSSSSKRKNSPKVGTRAQQQENK